MLRLDKRPSGIWRIRGTHHGVKIDQSARTREKYEADIIREKLEADIFNQVFGLTKPENDFTFADAVTRWLNAGKQVDPFPYLEKIIEVMADDKLADMTQGKIDARSFEVFPTQADATRRRHFYTPVSVILKFAAADRMMPFLPLNRPSGRTKKVPRIFTPAEFETLINADPDFAETLTFLVGTGARTSEAFGLDWKHVSSQSNRVTFWDTKGQLVRSIDLDVRTRSMMPPRHPQGGPVFRSPENGSPWSKNQDNNRFYGPALRMQRLAKRLGIPKFSPHTFRHTWASWHYAVHTDLVLLQRDGKWADSKSVQVYVHLGSPDLGKEVQKAGWFQRNSGH
ncbi:tyrosine-type recombinase/integrase [Litorimonas sp. WD9-15]|uniref:tyrosine-type recombinase/integrase n=1 Tax=Litorimonas sp. WD9-15 TaxID=3418716 RepID=UPI003CFFE0C1